MIPILYEKTETDFTSNGLCRLRDCISCIVTEERNGLYEVDFEYPVTGANYDKITHGRIIACTHDDTGDIQPFDIVSSSRPINGVVTFHGVHISYRLSGAVVSGTNINALSDALTLLGNSDPSTNFTFTADYTSSGYMAAADGVPRSVRQMLGGVEGSILDTYGGEYEFNKFNVILHSKRGTARELEIRYGLNMVDYNDETDYSESYNSVIPFWAGDDGNGNTVIVKGNRVDSGVTGYNGRTDCIPLDLTDKFENQPTTSELESMASSYMASNQTYLPSRSITVDFVRLQDTGEYANLSALFNCRLCDTIKVIFPAYNVAGRFKIVKTVYNVLWGKYDEMELGTLSTTLAEALGVGKESALSSSTGSTDLHIAGDIYAGESLFAGGFEFARESGENHVIVGGLHVCFGRVTITSSANAYKEVTVTLPYTYTEAPTVLTSIGNRTAVVRTAYGTQGSLDGNQIYVGVYATSSRTCYIHYMTIGV